MNEPDTRAQLIDPQLKTAGWGAVEGAKILREFRITDGKIESGGRRGKPDIADYILVYRNLKLAVVEAKRDEEGATEGVTQAKIYADKLRIVYTYSTNGKQIYEMDMRSGKEGYVASFPTPEQLWNWTFGDRNEWRDKFASVPFEDVHGTKGARYYQEIAVNKTMEAIADGRNRVLLTLATGTGKTFIAFQIAWKLFQTRWNLSRMGGRRPRVLFLADRNILADQAFNAFGAFPEDALVRISPADIRKKGSVPTNGSIFFTIFQTFMSGVDNTPYYGDYPKDFFDFIVVDECHRGGANNESNWRAILEYFSPAVQLGLTATPKRKDNVDTYKYFGEPVYIYSLKEGVNDGFLTPFKVKRIQTTLDSYVYTSDDEVIEGQIEQGKVYEEPDFNRIIEIKERETKRVQLALEQINQQEKSIFFCANQDHAAAVRDLINQYKSSKDPFYCVRVTANDGERGEQYLREFQDNEKSIPTILTTSQKLSTGVDARNVRNIVLMRPVNSIIEFKQIVGRGTRLFDGKDFFTIIDFVDAYKHFSDPEWDGEPLEPPVVEPKTARQEVTYKSRSDEGDELHDGEHKNKIKVKLADGKDREIQHMVSTSFYSPDGKPISAEEFLHNIFGALPELFKNESELRKIWSNPITRKQFFVKMEELGYGNEVLETLQKLINAEHSDLFDVLAYISFAITPISRQKRVEEHREIIMEGMDEKQSEFLEFVLSKYIEVGVNELGEEKLPDLLRLKYHEINDAEKFLGSLERIRNTFFAFQRNLYTKYHGF